VKKIKRKTGERLHENKNAQFLLSFAHFSYLYQEFRLLLKVHKFLYLLVMLVIHNTIS